MSSSQPSFATPQGSQSSAFSFAIPSSSFNSASSSFPGLSQETTNASSTSTLVDPNSPELFKQNVQIAMEHVARVNALARNSLNGIQHAYQAGVNPAQTKADLTALDQGLQVLTDILRQSGVGAYPLPTQNASPLSEQQLIADTTRGVQHLYEEFKRMQESSAVVTNLLGAPENLGRSKA